METWRRYIDHLPPADRVEGEYRPPTAHDVLALVRNVQKFYMSHPRQRAFSHSMTLCGQLIPTLDNHPTLLSLLPESELYALPFYGVLQSVIKVGRGFFDRCNALANDRRGVLQASANYPRMMEGLLTALQHIHDALGFPAGETGREAVAPIAELYALIFFFLSEFMDWYVRRSVCQLLKSHNQNVYAEFDHVIRHIQRRARHLPWQSEDAMDVDEGPPKPSWETSLYNSQTLWQSAQLSQVGLHGDSRRTAAQNTITRRLIWEIQQDAEERDRIREEQKQLLTQMFGSVSHQLQPMSEQSSGIACLTTAAAPKVGMKKLSCTCTTKL